MNEKCILFIPFAEFHKKICIRAGFVSSRVNFSLEKYVADVRCFWKMLYLHHICFIRFHLFRIMFQFLIKNDGVALFEK